MKVYVVYGDSLEGLVKGVYTEKALNNYLLSFLPYVKKQKQAQIEAWQQSINSCLATRKQMIETHDNLLKQEKALDNKYDGRYKEIHKKRKEALNFIDQRQKEIRIFENKIHRLNSFSDEQLLQGYLSTNKISYEEFSLIGYYD